VPQGWWPRVGRFVTSTRPGMASGLAPSILLLPMLLAATSMKLVNDALADLPDDSESVQGFEALARHFPAGDLSPVVLVIDDDEPLTGRAAFRALGDLSRNLKRLESVASVRSAAMPTDGVAPDLSDSDEVAEVLDGVASFEEQLGAAADGAGSSPRDRPGRGRPRRDRRPAAGADAGSTRQRTAGDSSPTGPRRCGTGSRSSTTGWPSSPAAWRAAGGLGEARDGAVQLRDEVAVPAEASSATRGGRARRDFTVGRADPAYRRAIEEVGETYGRLTGEDPLTGQQVEPGTTG
jgi:putative drug exporter of the RND superfamily